VRHEYVDGIVYALAGGTQAHSAITINVAARLHAAVQDGTCRVYSSDLKVRVAATRYLYPDVSVGCGAADQRDDADWLAAPRAVVEILSESTAAYDRVDKFALYRQIPSLRDYVLVETDRRLVEVHSREAVIAPGLAVRADLADGPWTVRRFGAGEVVDLPGLGAQVAVDAVYAGVAVD
jgi:Uma2 family endonuclease